MKTMQAAKGKWRAILAMYMDESHLNGKHGPCPLCGGRDRFRWLDYEGTGSWVCNQCSPKPSSGMDLLMRYTGKSFADLAARIDQEIGNLPISELIAKKDPSKRLERISNEVIKDIRFTPVHRYLIKRGIKVIPLNIGYHKAFGYYQDGKLIGKYPAMIARIQSAKGERVSFHVTYLTEKGDKADVPCQKKIISQIGQGAGVYLGKVNSTMLVAEGIETTLAGMQMFNMPGIAGLSAVGLERLELPPIVERVLILGDNDYSFTGQAAAFALAKRLYREGKAVKIQIPDDGTDYADCLKQ